MKLYRNKIPVIAKDTIAQLCDQGDIEVEPENREEAEKDIIAILEEFLRRDFELRNKIRDSMSNRNIPYDQYGRVRKRMSEEMNHPGGEDVAKFLARQINENLMISKFIEEVFEAEDVLYRKILRLLLSHNVDEREIIDEALSRIKNVAEGTVDYEIALSNAVKEVKKRRGLL